MSYIGTSKVGGMYFGDTKIAKGYLGSDLVYDTVPTTYTDLTYIKFTGTQSLKTDYYTNPKTHLVIDMQFEANGNASASSGVNNYWMGPNGKPTSGWFASNFGGNAGQYASIFYWFEKDFVSQTWLVNYSNIYTRDTWTYVNNVVSFLGKNKTTETKTTTQDTALVIGGYKSSTGVEKYFNRHNLKVYSFRIYEDGILLHEYLPKQRDNDGANGLYDTVTGKFFTSSSNNNLVGE